MQTIPCYIIDMKIMNEQTENNKTIYTNPVMEHYEVDVQMDLFDFLPSPQNTERKEARSFEER